VVDPDKFPGLAKFLAGLPAGLDSYPELKAKASMYRNICDERPIPAADLGTLPEVLVRLQDNPSPVSSWIPEVHSQAWMIAVYDRCFDDMDAFGAFTYRQGKALLEGPLYAIAFKIASPKLLLRSATLRWGAFHRGAGIEVSGTGRDFVDVLVQHPAGTYGAVVMRGICEGFRAALDICTGGGATFEVTDASPTDTRVTLRWGERSRSPLTAP
jgi:hypothetical protein